MPSLSRFYRILLAGIALAQSISAATISANFTSASTIPETASSYTATGNAVDFSLGFAPTRGTNLTLVNLTGRSFISGRFTNLVHGQRVHLRYGTTVYHFVADFYGGDGNDVVLQWAFRSPHAWGGNDSGQLGRGNTMLSGIPAAIQISGALAGKIPVALAAGEEHSLVLCSDGTVFAWGLNNAGQLGNGFPQNQITPTAVAINGTLSGKFVVAIAAGDYHSLALCSDGTLVAWGRNHLGQLGNGTTGNGSTHPVAVQTSNLGGRLIKSISVGASKNRCLPHRTSGSLVFAYPHHRCI